CDPLIRNQFITLGKAPFRNLPLSHKSRIPSYFLDSLPLAYSTSHVYNLVVFTPTMPPKAPMPRLSDHPLSTEREVQAAKPKAGRRTEYRIKGVRGLTLRVSRGGTKSWELYC